LPRTGWRWLADSLELADPVVVWSLPVSSMLLSSSEALSQCPVTGMPVAQQPERPNEGDLPPW